MASATEIKFGDYLNVTDEGAGVIRVDGCPPGGAPEDPQTRLLLAVFDGGGAALTTGVKLDVTLDFDCTITGWRLLGDQSGSVVVDIWKDTYANYPPVVGDSITASAKPTISTATKNESSTLTGWTTAVTAGDTLRFNIDSVTSLTRVTLSLSLQP